MMKRDGEFVSGVKVIVLCHGDKLNAAIHVIDVQAKQFALDVLLDGSKQALIDREMYFSYDRIFNIKTTLEQIAKRTENTGSDRSYLVGNVSAPVSHEEHVPNVMRVLQHVHNARDQRDRALGDETGERTTLTLSSLVK